MRKVSRQLFCRIVAGPLFFASPFAHADVVISSGATQNMSCSNGVCAPTATSAVLNVGDLESMLASGNLEVTTTGTGVEAHSIDVSAPFSWSTSNALSLEAYQSIAVAQHVSVVGAGGLSVVTNNGGNGGTFAFGPKGNVTFSSLASPLTIDGESVTLVDSLPSLAAAVAAGRDGRYALANNYDASQDGTYGRAPISKLRGMLEGLGNTISKLSVAGHTYSAMVGVVYANGEIDNLRLTGIHIRGWGHLNNVAGLAAQNEGYLFGDSVTGSVTAKGREQLAGGLVGWNTSTGMIVSSWANVRVTALNNGGAGGLVGDNSGTVELSHAEGDVSSGGGFVGLNEGLISQSFATGAVSGGEAGGFVGSNTVDQGTAAIENSYATGDVTGGLVGGFVSLGNDVKGATVSASYSTGAVTGEYPPGGFECEAYNFTDDYWDTTISGTTYSGCFDVMDKGVTGLTSNQLQSGLPAGFDPKIWAEKKSVNNGFPYLIANPPAKK